MPSLALGNREISAEILGDAVESANAREKRRPGQDGASMSVTDDASSNAEARELGEVGLGKCRTFGIKRNNRMKWEPSLNKRTQDIHGRSQHFRDRANSSPNMWEREVSFAPRLNRRVQV